MADPPHRAGSDVPFYLTMGTLGGSYSMGYGINTLGQIVGSSQMSDEVAHHAFVYDPLHGMVDLNTLITAAGWNLFRAHDINESGQIVGQGYLNGEMHAFLLTPVPEPSSLALATTGCATLILLARRRRP